MSSLRWPVVLFDLDGTLVNTVPLILRSYEVAFAEVLGERIDESVVRPLVGMTLFDALAGYSRTDDLITAYRRFNLAHLEDLQEDYEGVLPLVEGLGVEGAVLGVVTSKIRATALRSLAAGGFGTLIPILAAQGETERHKPHPDPLLSALGQLGRHPREAVYVGDSVWDLQAARAAGTAAIGVTWGAAPREALLEVGPDAVVDSPAELAEALGMVAVTR
ncbi:MAG: HAD hydrolase-like protein [Propionibacterium sp.]|nr:HAD hydrolase-like protein [Propionibacterium sp.]